MKTGLIYLATNKLNNKKYVGQSYTNLNYRKNRHIRTTFNFGSNLTFHQAIRKHGTDNFEWNIIEDNIPLDALDDKEIFWIKEHNSFINGYNMNEGGGTSRGYHHTEKTKKQISESMKGRSNRDHMIARYGEEDGEIRYQKYLDKLKLRKGKTRLQGFIEKHGEIEGTKKHEEFITKLKKYRTGRKMSEEHKLKIKLGSQNRKKDSEETKRKKSKAKKLYWVNKKRGI